MNEVDLVCNIILIVLSLTTTVVIYSAIALMYISEKRSKGRSK